MSRALMRAIKLRQWVRRAIDVGDDEALRFWNRKADEAYAALEPGDAQKYSNWALDAETRRMLGMLAKV